MSSPTKNPSPVLLTAPEVLSLRHGPSWLLLASAAGAVNAGALLACERFVSHVTGTATRIGVDAGQWALMLDYTLVLVAFIAGAMASVLPLQRRARRGERPAHAAPLLLTAVVLALTALAGHHGAFGPVGGTIEQPADFGMLCVLSFAMGLMNASVATSTALAVRTTHMTGPATDFGVHLATAWISEGDERRTALRMAALRGSKLGAFIGGGLLMVPLVGALGYLAFLAPSLAVLVATARSFAVARGHAAEPVQAVST